MSWVSPWCRRDRDRDIQDTGEHQCARSCPVHRRDKDTGKHLCARSHPVHLQSVSVEMREIRICVRNCVICLDSAQMSVFPDFHRSREMPTHLCGVGIARDLPHCRSVIFFPAGVLPVGKKMTLRQCGISRVKPSSVAEIDLITYKLSISCYHTVSVSPSFPHYVDAEDTSEHIGARSCFLRTFLYLLRHRADTEDTNEHTGARSCLVCPFVHLFDLARMPRT